MKPPIRVYRNLHKSCYSVQEFTRGVGWRVTGHYKSLLLGQAYFKVSWAGRERVRQTKRKAVHAWAIGNLLEACPLVSIYDVHLAGRMHKVTYSPYEHSFFMLRDPQTNVPKGRAISVYRYCVLDSGGMRVYDS